MSTPPLFVGIDLGTTNSAAAVFDGEKVTLVRNSQGSSLTPSVVRIDGKGAVTVGAKAYRMLESDSANTSAEFKRLMGTSTPIEFKAAKVTRLPQELAAEVLKSLRADIQEQFGVGPERVVISVPALFELPQCAATSEAAKMAGFERCELIQEPIASALASGWKAHDQGGNWLVYDLGGGTFDASLLEEQDGFLRVVGHDGDNFLGGRDFDWAIADWVLDQIKERHGLAISRSDSAAKQLVRKVKQVAEEAKIELTRQTSTAISLPALADGIDVELELDRPLLERLCSPLVERSVLVCQRLLEQHKVSPTQIRRVVMVGGPTVMPFVRRMVEAGLHAPFGESLDPMTLVAQGAALYAAMTNLDGRPAEVSDRRTVTRLWLNYPAMTSDVTPHVVGRVVEEAGGRQIRSIRLIRQEGAWQSAETKLDAEAGFAISVELLAHKLNTFQVQARDAGGKPVDVEPSTVRMVHGLTISDPPLSRSVGVALADDTVQVYFKRGEPLPARRTFHHKTVETVARGSAESVLKVPVVQGELGRAHLCRVIGALDIRGRDIKNSLPGSEVQLTLELDRSGRLSARALVPALNQVFEEVASLLVPDASVDTLAAALKNHRQRMQQVRWAPFQSGSGDGVDKVVRMELMLDEAERDLKAAQGGDIDAGQKAQRNLQEVDALLEDLEMVGRWGELDAEARSQSVVATRWVSLYGSEVEKHLLDEALEAVEQARKQRKPLELERELRVVRDLGNAAFNRHPDAVRFHFEHLASRADQARDLPKARELVKAGESALAKKQLDKVNTIIDQLYQLLPPDAARRRLGHQSGLQ